MAIKTDTGISGHQRGQALNRTVITAGIIGSMVAAACCATPILAIVLGALGLGAWLSKADFVLLPLLAVSLGLIALGLCRWRAASRSCCDSASSNQDIRS
jgi:mercuric ion transport protein